MRRLSLTPLKTRLLSPRNVLVSRQILSNQRVKKPYLFCLVGFLLAAMTVEASAQSNTIVRFRVSYGTKLLGNIDVELFDQDKPVTVANFLNYVDSGRYKRTLLHRLIPGFIMQ